jgi:hypothetical protein
MPNLPSSFPLMPNQLHNFFFSQMYKTKWKTNDIVGYLNSDEYRKLSNTVTGKPKITTKIKFAWYPIVLKSKRLLWLKRYVEKRLNYLNVEGKERWSMQEYTVAKLKKIY